LQGGGITLNNQKGDEEFYVNVKELHSNEELLEINDIKIISIEVGLWSPITWR
jgi:hypothetical protein